MELSFNKWKVKRVIDCHVYRL